MNESPEQIVWRVFGERLSDAALSKAVEDKAKALLEPEPNCFVYPALTSHSRLDDMIAYRVHEIARGLVNQAIRTEDGDECPYCGLSRLEGIA